MEDGRFKHIATDPKFRRISKGAQKVKIDKRFKSMFNDKKFKIKYTVDKRGRPVNRTSTEDLKRYYQLSSEEEFSDEESNDNKPKTTSKYKNLSNDLVNLSDEDEGNENEPGHSVKVQKLSNKVKKKLDKSKFLSTDEVNRLKNLNIDYARGEAPLYSESSSDDAESENELSESDKIEHKWGELDADADKTAEATYRLAACNMDWDRIRALDLMILLNSFLPPGGVVKSVAIYPSEFGKQRIKEEEIKGPIELVQTKNSQNVEENEEGSQYHMEKLRQYQLNRLKYYYAVIVFDKAVSANKVYSECDGMEYESSAIKLDLRFVPDDMTFDDEPKDFCDKLPEMNKYEPRFFTTTALQQVKVDLTWDETNPDRAELAQKLNSGKVDDISEVDLQNYLASSSEEDDGENGALESDTELKADVIDKYKALLQHIEDKERDKNKKDVELEISWGIDLKQKTEKLVKQKTNDGESVTPFQKYLEKRQEKRKEKRTKKKQLDKDNESDDNDTPSGVDMSDPYFAEEFDKPEFRTQEKPKKIFDEPSNVEEDDQKEAELKLLLMNEDENNKHFNFKKIKENEVSSKKKRNKDTKKDEYDFEVDVNDERFSALFSSHHYNIDPTDSHYKKTKGMEALINEKLKRRIDDSLESEIQMTNKKLKNADNGFNKTSNKRIELNMLVKSVKRKTKAFKNKK